MLNFTWIESNCKTIYYHVGAKIIAKSVQALYLISKNLRFIWIFLANNSLLLVQLGIFASNVFVLCFFYEKHIRDFLKRREKIVSRTSLPNMGKGGEQIVYDNQCNLAYWSVWYDHTFDRFRRAGELGIAQEEARVAQGEIITASGVSDDDCFYYCKK